MPLKIVKNIEEQKRKKYLLVVHDGKEFSCSLSIVTGLTDVQASDYKIIYKIPKEVGMDFYPDWDTIELIPMPDNYWILDFEQGSQKHSNSK